MTQINLYTKMGAFLSALVCVSISLSSVAQQIVTEPAAPASQATSNTGSLSNLGGTPSTIAPIAGFKSYNDTRRLREIQLNNGPRSRSKNEVFVGFKDVSGWSGFVQAVETAKNYGDSTKNQLSPSDPSLSVTHPAVFDNGKVKIGGMFRQYFPVSDFSTKWQIYQSAYYSILSAKLPRGRDLANTLAFRYFSQPSYAPSHTRTFAEDRTTITTNVASWLRAGIGQNTQLEWHPGTNTGTTVEIFPFADFIMGKTTYLSPRIYFPVYSNGEVFDAPKSVSSSEVLAELFFQTTL